VVKQGLQLFGGDWTEQKLEALRQYLAAYAKVLSKQKYERVYVDAFAGTGYREKQTGPLDSYAQIFGEEEGLAGQEVQLFLDGSPPIALRVVPPFHRFVFVELRKEKARELERLKQSFPERAASIDVRRGDANLTIRELCRTWDRGRSRGVLFLDPFGMQVEWSAIQAIAGTRAIDVWILFPFAVNRLLTKDPKDIPSAWRKRLNDIFGSDEWAKRFYKERTIEDMFSGSETVVEKALTLKGLGAYYHERLQTVFPIVAPNPRVLRNSRNSPLFQLFFAAANPGKGGEIAVKIAQHILREI